MSTLTAPVPRGPPRSSHPASRHRRRTLPAVNQGRPATNTPALRPNAQTGTLMYPSILLTHEALAAAAAPADQAGSTGPALAIVLGLVLIIAVGKLLRRMATVVAALLASASSMLGLLATVFGVGALATVTMITVVAVR